jgi:hypothetical protein
MTSLPIWLQAGVRGLVAAGLIAVVGFLAAYYLSKLND